MYAICYSEHKCFKISFYLQSIQLPSVCCCWLCIPLLLLPAWMKSWLNVWRMTIIISSWTQWRLDFLRSRSLIMLLLLGLGSLGWRLPSYWKVQDTRYMQDLNMCMLVMLFVFHPVNANTAICRLKKMLQVSK